MKVITLQSKGDYVKHESLSGIDVNRYKWWRVPKVSILLDGYIYAAFAYQAIRQVYSEGDFDLIDAHWIYPDGFAAVLLGDKLGKPVVLSGRGTDVNEFCFRWPVKHLARRALLRATSVIAVSNPMKERMKDAGLPAERVTVIQNGVDLSVFHQGDSGNARRSLGIPLNQKVLLYIGSIVEAKGLQYLIKGLKLLLSRNSLHLYIIGPGDYREKLEHLTDENGVRDYVTFFGRVAHQDLVCWYQAADFFCFGSLREGCPNAVIESLACGTPVVSTNVGGIPDLVQDGKTGILFEPGSAKAFAMAMETALSRTWDREEIAAHGASRSWNQVASEFYSVFERAVTKFNENSRV